MRSGSAIKTGQIIRQAELELDRSLLLLSAIPNVAVIATLKLSPTSGI